MADPANSEIVAGTVKMMVEGPPDSTQRVAGMTMMVAEGPPDATLRVAGLVYMVVEYTIERVKSQAMMGSF